MPLWNFPLPGGSITITEIVAEEIKRGSFRYMNWLQSGRIEELQGQEETIFKQLSQQPRPRIHEGEASAIAIALHRGWTLVTDDKGAKWKAEIHNVRFLGWREFLEEWLHRP